MLPQWREEGHRALSAAVGGKGQRSGATGVKPVVVAVMLVKVVAEMVGNHGQVRELEDKNLLISLRRKRSYHSLKGPRDLGLTCLSNTISTFIPRTLPLHTPHAHSPLHSPLRTLPHTHSPCTVPLYTPLAHSVCTLPLHTPPPTLPCTNTHAHCPWPFTQPSPEPGMTHFLCSAICTKRPSGQIPLKPTHHHSLCPPFPCFTFCA